MAMKTRRSYGRWSLGLAVALGATAMAGDVSADAPAERAGLTKTLKGGVLVIGTTLAHDCNNLPPAGADCSGELQFLDPAPDVYWVDGAAVTVNAAAANTARSAATLTIPAGATVDSARLYWASKAPTADTSVELSVGGNAADTVTADAADVDEVDVGGDVFYQASADVTALVTASGEYAVTGVDGPALINVLDDVVFSAWTLVVTYADPAGVATRVTVFDGLSQVLPAATTTVAMTLAAPTTSAVGVGSTFTLVGYDGDDELATDSVTFAGTILADALNPNINFFNSSNTIGGAAVASGTADQLSGNPDTNSGYDLDTVSLPAGLVTSGLASADVVVAAGLDTVLVGVMVTSVPGCGANTDCPEANTACDTNTGNCVATCTGNGDCAEPTPVCDVAGGICVDCLADTDCDDGETCNTTTHVCEGGGTGGAGGAGGGGSASGGAGVGATGTGATGTSSGQDTTGVGGNDFSGLAAEGGGCSLSAGSSAKQTALLFGVFAAAAGLLARRRRRS
jgi:hypothetical protein